MIRELTKSALSFTWALSLLGLKQTASLGKMGQDDSGDLFAPVTQVAVGQLDESMKGLYRSGDSLGSRMVDLAFGSWNPMNWFNSAAWTSAGTATNPGSGMNPSAWMNPSTWMRTVAQMGQSVTGCCGQAAGQQSDASTWAAPGRADVSSSAGGDVPVSDQGAAASWGPPHG